MKRLIIALSLLFSVSCVKASDVISVNQFSGLNIDDAPLVLQEGQTPDSQNVVTDDGFGLRGRKGFVRYSTEPSASGMWEFPLSNGTRYLITRSGGNLKATTDGTFSVTIGTVPTDRVIAASPLGDKFFYSDTLNGLKYWDGSAVTTSSSAMTFSMLTTFKGRLVGAGKSGSERVLFLSEYLDGTNWTLVTNPAETDPSQITVSGALDENIQAIYSSFQDKLMWFKKNSFGGLYGSRRSNFSARTFSDRIGIASVETIQDCDGKLRWLGNNRKVYEFDGAQFGPINDQVDDIFEGVSQGDSNTRSTTLTLEADFSPGISSYTETSITLGSVVLSTQATSPFVDTTKTNFGGGTGVNITSTIVNGSLVLSTYVYTTSPVDINQSEIASQLPNNGVAIAQSFVVSTPCVVNTLGFLVSQINGSGCSPTVRLKSDSSSTPGSNLASGSMSNSLGWQDISMSAHGTLVPNTTYWAYIDACSASNSLSFNYVTMNQYPNGILYYSGPFGTSDMTFRIYFTAISTSAYSYYGSYISRTFDVGTTTNSWLFNWNTFNASGTIPSGTSVTYRTQSSANGTTWTNPLVVATGSVPTSLVQRYVRYLATFTTTVEITTPQLDDVIINATGKRKLSGTYISPAVDFGSGITSLGSFSVSETEAGGNITYEFQTSTDSSSSLFLSTGWIAITPSFTSTAPVRRYGAFRSSFSATSITDSLSLDAATFNWSEGSNLKASSGYIDQRYWIGCAISSTSNNRVLVYDKNRQWQRYVGYAPEIMGMYNSRLYVGNTNGIFLTEQGYDDNGTPITSYYTVKTLAPSNLDLYTKFVELRFTTDNSDNVLAPTYQVDESGTDYSLGSQAMNAKAGIQNLKFPFSTGNVQQGKFMNMKFTATGSSFWRLLNANLYYDKDVVPD